MYQNIMYFNNNNITITSEKPHELTNRKFVFNNNNNINNINIRLKVIKG